MRFSVGGSCRSRGGHVAFISLQFIFINNSCARLTSKHDSYAQDKRTRMTESPRRKLLHVSGERVAREVEAYSLEMKRSLLTFRPYWPFANRGVSVHISLAFSRTILQWRSKALTRASIFRLFRQEIRTCVRERTAVWRMERGPVVSSCSSTWATSYSLGNS